MDIAGTALDFVRVLKNTKVFGTFSTVLTGISIGLDLLENLTKNVNSFTWQDIVFFLGSIGLSYLGAHFGVSIGLVIGGLPGAIFGTIFSILLATLFEDLFKQIFGI